MSVWFAGDFLLWFGNCVFVVLGLLVFVTRVCGLSLVLRISGLVFVVVMDESRRYSPQFSEFQTKGLGSIQMYNLFLDLAPVSGGFTCSGKVTFGSKLNKLLDKKQNCFLIKLLN